METTVTIGDILADINTMEMAGALLLLTSMNAESVGDHETVAAFEAQMMDPDSPIGFAGRALVARLRDAVDLYGFDPAELDRAMGAFVYEITTARDRVVRRFGGRPTYYGDH